MKFKHAARFMAASAMAVMVTSAAVASPDDDGLVIAWGSTSPIEHVDNYVNTNQTDLVQPLVWDQLIYREPKTFEYKPLLAKSWKALSPTVWRSSCAKASNSTTAKLSTPMTWLHFELGLRS